MTADGAVGDPPARAGEPDRWWPRGYAIRLTIALTIASVIVGGVVGPGTLLLNQLETAWAGGSLWYPDWMYWQAALLQIVPGIVIAGGGSFAAVLMMPRPVKPSAVVRRLLVGPILAGLLLTIISLLWSGAGLLRVVVMTAIACVVFALAGMLAGATNVERAARAASDRDRSSGS